MSTQTLPLATPEYRQAFGILTDSGLSDDRAGHLLHRWCGQFGSDLVNEARREVLYQFLRSDGETPRDAAALTDLMLPHRP